MLVGPHVALGGTVAVVIDKPRIAVEVGAGVEVMALRRYAGIQSGGGRSEVIIARPDELGIGLDVVVDRGAVDTADVRPVDVRTGDAGDVATAVGVQDAVMDSHDAARGVVYAGARACPHRGKPHVERAAGCEHDALRRTSYQRRCCLDVACDRHRGAGQVFHDRLRQRQVGRGTDLDPRRDQSLHDDLRCLILSAVEIDCGAGDLIEDHFIQIG